MIHRLKKIHFTPHTLSLLIYCVFFLFIVIANYPLGKTIIGWDAINPELNFFINFKRAFFAFWQENYGVGLLGGHGFAATLPHTFVAFMLSLFLPTNAIRPVITFVCLFLGGLGVYYLARHLLHDSTDKSTPSSHHAYFDYFACIGALFYIMDIGTIQMFYVQLEAFIFHFAALPWLFLSFIYMLEKKLNKKIIFSFVLINFFSSVQSFVPPLFIAYMIAFTIFSFFFLLKKRFSLPAIKRICFIFLLTLLVNLYWLIPFIYYVLASSGTYLDSYNNILSTPEFIEKNKNFGNISNVLLLRGFLFTNNIFSEPLLGEWVNQFNSILIQTIGYIFVLFSLLGLTSAIFKQKKWKLFGFAGIFIFFFTALTTNTPPFSYVTDFLQTYVPLYRQAFRFSFTKFSIGLAFSYSILLVIGLFVFSEWVNKKRLSHHINQFIIATAFILLLIYSSPLFKGELFYKRLILNLPNAYTEIMAYFNTQTDGRIADFPQDCPDGWATYNWGYTGSGFYWYGVKQPFMSRTFDVWHNANENYYWEMTNALRMKEYGRMDAIFQKYGVRWVLYDGNIKHCRNERALLQDEQLLDYLIYSGNYDLQKKTQTEVDNPIYIFEANRKKEQSYVYVTNQTPNIIPTYNFTDYDRALNSFSTYETSSDKRPNVIIPFRSLFNKRTPSESEFKLSQENNEFRLQSSIKIVQGGTYTLNLPSYQQLESIIPVTLQIKNVAPNKYSLTAEYLFPTVSINKVTVYQNMFTAINLGTFQTNSLNSTSLLVNDKEYQLDNNFTTKLLFYTQVNNALYVLDKSKNPLITWNSGSDSTHQTLIATPLTKTVDMQNENEVEISFPRLNNQVELGREYVGGFINNIEAPCDSPDTKNQNWNEVGTAKATEYTRLISKNDAQCLNFNFNEIQTGLGYILQTETRNVLGFPPKIELSNKKGSFYLSTYLEKKNEFNISNIILPPTYRDAFGYKVTIKNYSLNDGVSTNDYMRVGLWYLPYHFITDMVLTQSNLTNSIGTENTDAQVIHPNETEYQLQIPANTLEEDNKVILLQSFNTGWRAYEMEGKPNWIQSTFPFLFGKEIKDHVLINNWANGWRLRSDSFGDPKGTSNIVIVFLPQYLQFIGFGLLVATFVGIFFWKEKK